MRSSRRGFSLMEVLLSTAILVGSSVALIELATIGRKQASAAYDLNRAQLLCQAKLDEIIAGIGSLQPVESQELEEDPEWLYSIEQQPLRDRDLLEVKVTVFQADRTDRKPQRFSLVRWLPDPMQETLPGQPVGSARTTSPSELPRREPLQRGESRR